MKKTLLIAGGIVVLVTVLAGAAFLAGRMLTRPVTSEKASSMTMTMGSDGQTKYQIADVDMKHAEELPDRPPDVTGLMIKAENNSIYIGIGPRRDFGFSAAGSGEYDADDFDAIVEVVVTRSTEMYKDVTGVQVLKPGQELETVRQKVAPLRLDELSGQGLIMAWGERRGDRLIADVVLCRIGC
jgi:hypothetical protein